MKKLALIFGVYVATFFVGVLFVVFLNIVKTKPTIVVKPQVVEQTIEKVEIIKEVVKTSKVFEVKNFFDGIGNEPGKHPNKHLIQTGEFSNGEDFKVKNGETWLGLFVDDEESSLKQTKVYTSRKKTEDFIWTTISIKDKKKPLFLVKNLKKVKAGKIETLFHSNDSEEDNEDIQPISLGKDFSKEFNLGDKQYKLWVEEGLSEENEPILVLFLSNESMTQMIHYIYYSGGNEPVGSLYWTGDLDSDGKLDFYMDFWNYEKGSYPTGLFLSSEVGKEKLVKKFNYLAYGGC